MAKRRTKAAIKKDKERAAEAAKVDTASGPVTVYPSDVKLCDISGGREDRLVVAHRIYNGHEFVEVRRWYKDRNSQEYRPTNKGCSIGSDPDTIRTLAKALMRGAEVMELAKARKEGGNEPE